MGYLPRVRDQDRRLGRSTYRQRIVTALEHFSLLAAEVGQGTALGGACAALAADLQRRWGPADSVMQLCRAFRAADASA